MLVTVPIPLNPVCCSCTFTAESYHTAAIAPLLLVLSSWQISTCPFQQQKVHCCLLLYLHTFFSIVCSLLHFFIRWSYFYCLCFAAFYGWLSLYPDILRVAICRLLERNPVWAMQITGKSVPVQRSYNPAMYIAQSPCDLALTSWTTISLLPADLFHLCPSIVTFFTYRKYVEKSQYNKFWPDFFICMK